MTRLPSRHRLLPFKSGEKIDLGKLVDKDYTAKLTLDAAGYNGLQSYNLVVTLEESTNTAIERVQMDEQLLTEVEGTDISVSVPYKTDLANVGVVLFTKPDVKSISGFERAYSEQQKDTVRYCYGTGETVLYNDMLVWVKDNGGSGYYKFNETTGKLH